MCLMATTWGWRRDWQTARNRLWSNHPCRCQTDEKTPLTSVPATHKTHTCTHRHTDTDRHTHTDTDKTQTHMHAHTDTWHHSQQHIDSRREHWVKYGDVLGLNPPHFSPFPVCPLYLPLFHFPFLSSPSQKSS